ncbi:MAG: trypsin-like peptidase domain-containing protein [Gammaproteobacteria bacterium]
MSLKNLFSFLLQSVLVGLAAAILLLLWRPDILGSRPDSPHASPGTGDSSASAPASYHTAVEQAAPAVVNVLTSRVYQTRRNPLLQDPILREFFGTNEEYIPDTRRDNNYGSGVLMNAEGYVLTNNHLIADADEIQVTLRDGRQTQARIIGSDPDTDLAVLKIELDNLPSIRITKNQELLIGDVVLAIGNPYGFGQTVTQGIVSATGRKRLGITTFEDFIQTDAAINPGNSGGALVNAQGDLIGINTAIISNTGGSQGIGLATPAHIASDVMQQIIEHGHVTRGWLGIEAQLIPPGTIPEDIAPGGVLVAAVMSNGPADVVGIQPGDIIIGLAKEPITDPEQAIRMITDMQPGEEINIQLLRGWEVFETTAKVAERPTFRR